MEPPTAPTAPEDETPHTAASSPAGDAPPTARGRARAAVGNPWQSWLAWFVAAGFAAGVLWWLLAPGGAFYADSADYAVWFPRDATLAALMVVAGIASAVLALRGQFLPKRRRRAMADKPARTLFAALVVGGFAASVIAWRTGVFAGDLFHTPPEPMASPSMVFSLRSPTVLILWPLASSAAVFVRQLISYSFTSGPAAETMRNGNPGSG